MNSPSTLDRQVWVAFEFKTDKNLEKGSQRYAAYYDFGEVNNRKPVLE